MKTSPYFLYLISCVFFVTISVQDLNSQEVEKVIINTKIKAVPYITDILKIDKYVELETIDELKFENADCIRVRNDTFFVFERRRLSVWSPEGNLICSYGKAISGCSDVTAIRYVNLMSKELDLPTDFAIVPGKSQVAIWDNLKSQVFIYDFKGKLINKIRPDIKYVANFTWTNNNQLIFSSFDEKQGGSYNSFIVTDLDGEIVKGLVPYSELERASVGSYSYFPSFKNKQYLYRQYGHCIYEFTLDTLAKPYKEFWFDERNVIPDYIHEAEGDTYSLMKGLKEKKCNVLWGFQEFEKFYSIVYVDNNDGLKLFTHIISKDRNNQFKIQHKPKNFRANSYFLVEF